MSKTGYRTISVPDDIFAEVEKVRVIIGERTYTGTVEYLVTRYLSDKKRPLPGFSLSPSDFSALYDNFPVVPA